MLANIKQFLSNIVLSLTAIFLTFAVLDAFWLGWLAKSWYQTQMQDLLRVDFITWPWLVFYLMYGCVTFVLAIVPNREKPWSYAAIDGALLGLASYGAYNLTCYSIIEGFTLKIMLIDWSWGVFISASSAVGGWFGFQWLRK
jgi:uncharacterized membrane protein